MSLKDDLKKVYLDNSTIEPWFEGIMTNNIKLLTSGFINFLIEHKEILKFISTFTVAELIEKLLFKTNNIKQYMKKKSKIEDFVETFRCTIPNLKILEDETSRTGEKGLFICAEDLLAFTTKIGSTKDAIHICIAKHEGLYFVTKDDDAGRVQSIYEKTIGMKGFMRALSK